MYQKVEEKDRILFHKQVTAEGGMSIADQVKYSTIYFDWVKYNIDESMSIDLKHLVELLVSEKGKGLNLIVQGHYGVEEAGFIEKNEYLKGLDLKRAEKIKAYLIENGVSADRMEVVGKGKDALSNEGTEEYQKAQNRMVDFIIK